MNKIKQFIVRNWPLIITLLLVGYFVDQKQPIYVFLTLTLGLALWRLLLYKENFIETKQYIETVIWGKPLKKELWDKGELKNTKVKFVWGKKK